MRSSTTHHALRAVRLLAGASVIGLTVVPPAAAARPDGAPGSRSVTFTASRQIVGGDAECDPTQPARCGFTFRNVLTVSGDLSGTGYSVGSAVLLANGSYLGTAVTHFDGAVAGCGTGSLVLLESGVITPAGGSGGVPGTWQIIEGSGALASASGGGTITTVFEGTVRCR